MPNHAEAAVFAAVARELLIDLSKHIKWVRAIARGVRRDRGFLAGSQEEQELESTAYLLLVECGNRFDESRLPPEGDIDGAFRGAYSRHIRSELRRAALRLRNGGVFYTTNSPEWQNVAVAAMPADEDGGEVLAWPRREDGEEEEWPESIECRHEPTLVVVNSKAG